MNEADIPAIMDEATNLRNNGKTILAIEKYQTLIAEFQRIGKTDQVAYCWQMIGVCHTIADNPIAAIKALKTAGKLFENAKDDFGAGNTYRDVGLAQIRAGQYKKAIVSLKKSERLLAPTKKFASLGVTQTKIGLAYLKANKLSLAKKYLEMGLATIRREGDWFMEATALIHFADYYYLVEKYTEMINALWAAMGLILEKGEAEKQERRMAEIYGLLALGYEKIGNRAFGKTFSPKAEKIISKLSPSVQKVLRENIYRNLLTK